MKLLDTLYYAWVIGLKDIKDALKNKGPRINFLLMLFMVGLFYWLSDLRPIVDVVVYDEGKTAATLDQYEMPDGTEYYFHQAGSLQDMTLKMANKNLGLVFPADFNRVSDASGTPGVDGYIFWVDRNKVAQLEAKYSQALTEIIGKPVQVTIDDRIITPLADADGQHANVTFQMVYFVFITALSLIPHLLHEEKQTKTMDALLASPASTGQVVLGKALAGFFYILIIGGFALILFSRYIVNWPLALAAFLGYALLAVGLGLLVGSFFKSIKQLSLWILGLALFLMLPPLFYNASNLKAGIRVVLTWMPTSALASLFRFSCSTGVTWQHLLPNLAVVLLSISVVFGLVTWKVRRSDR